MNTALIVPAADTLAFMAAADTPTRARLRLNATEATLALAEQRLAACSPNAPFPDWLTENERTFVQSYRNSKRVLELAAVVRCEQAVHAARQRLLAVERRDAEAAAELAGLTAPVSFAIAAE